MRLDFTLVHLSPLVNSYKGRDYFSAFVFYSANLKDLANLTKLAASKGVLAACHPECVHSAVADTREFTMRASARFARSA